MPKHGCKRKANQVKNKSRPKKKNKKSVLPSKKKENKNEDEKTEETNIDLKKIENKYKTTLSTKKSAQGMLDIIDSCLNKNENNFLVNLHNIFDGFDEIKITSSEDKTHNMELTLNKDKDNEIKFSIIYDNNEDYFEYQPIKIKADLIGDDIAFYEELYIPKEDFFKLIMKFKNQYKFKEENKSEDKKEDKNENSELSDK